MEAPWSDPPAQRRPGRGLTIAGIILIVLAIVLGLISGGVLIWSFAGLDLDQFAIVEATVPGTLEFEAEQPGNYFLAVPDAPGFSPRTDLTIELRSLDSGDTLPLGDWELFGETLEDGTGDEEMVPFRVDEPGEYALEVSNGDADEHDAVVGRLPTEMVGRMAIGGLTAFCGGGLTVLLLIVGVVLLVIGLLKQ